ncbi:MAG: hypothetical protein H7Y38_20480 [Armatimonadetes bacterium]|nr:hypothetical protein [Armatimonadota bacterium]
MERNDSVLDTKDSYSVADNATLITPTNAYDTETINTDEFSISEEPLRTDLEYGMSSDVSAGVAAGTNFGGNTDADTDAGLSYSTTSGFNNSTTAPETINAVADKAKAATKDGIADAKVAIKDATDAAKDKAGELVEQAKTQASALTAQATDKVKEQIGDRKTQAAESLTAFTDVIRQTASGFEEKGQAPLANAVTGLASKVDDFAGYLSNKNVDELAGDITAYAKKNPQVFVGGAFLLGIALARFLKSSNRNDMGYQNSSTSTGSTGYGSSQGIRNNDVSGMTVYASSPSSNGNNY